MRIYLPSISNDAPLAEDEYRCSILWSVKRPSGWEICYFIFLRPSSISSRRMRLGTKSCCRLEWGGTALTLPWARQLILQSFKDSFVDVKKKKLRSRMLLQNEIRRWCTTLPRMIDPGCWINPWRCDLNINVLEFYRVNALRQIRKCVL